ncbi:MAG: hypothetical protein DMG32_21755 [Acidobacteria bacterium]|nr:MAG: hypothetical protein DMG32_21755 [Acidobacteriota bacterium]
MASAKGYTAEDLIEAFCMGAEYGRNARKLPVDELRVRAGNSCDASFFEEIEARRADRRRVRAL